MKRDLNNDEMFEKSQSRTGNPANDEANQNDLKKKEDASDRDEMTDAGEDKNTLKDENA